MRTLSGSAGGHSGGMAVYYGSSLKGDLRQRRHPDDNRNNRLREITRAAGSAISNSTAIRWTMNTYLKVTILALAAVCFTLAALAWQSHRALANMRPLIIRINDVGHADAIDYRNFQYRPQEAENKYYLTRWSD